VDETVTRSVTSVERHGDKMIVVRLKGYSINIMVVQVYMPTTAHNDEEIDIVYEELSKIIGAVKTKSH